MSSKTIIHVVGNRPQFIKLAVLYDAIAKRTDYKQLIIHTGQHSSAAMSDIFFNELSIPSPDVQFDIEAVTADEFIGKASAQVYSFLSARKGEDYVLVYGDTNTTLAASLAARRSGKILLHFEAGVRTKDVSMPEEINRTLSDRLADVHYCCTQKNADTLLKEGYGSAIPSQVVCTGDLMLDAFLHIVPSDKNVMVSADYIACTIHRAANIMNRKNLKEIVDGLNEIHQQLEVIVPLHPHTAKRLKEFEIDTYFTTIAPLGYREMKRFICDAKFIITDSGGASREAFFAKKKSLIVMEHPFWYEIIEVGASLHCGADKEAIVNKFFALSSLHPHFEEPIFGNGDAALNIAAHLNSMTH